MLILSIIIYIVVSLFITYCKTQAHYSLITQKYNPGKKMPKALIEGFLFVPSCLLLASLIYIAVFGVFWIIEVIAISTISSS